MKYDEFVSSCIVHMNRSIQKQGLSEEKKKQILEEKVLREELIRESHHELQCSCTPDISSDSHGIHIDPCYKKYVRHYFSWLIFRYFQRYACSKCVVFLFQRSSCSKVLAFQLNGCSRGYNSQKQLAMAFFKKAIFLQNLILGFPHEIVPVQKMQVQSSLKINSFKDIFLKFCDSISF